MLERVVSSRLLFSLLLLLRLPDETSQKTWRQTGVDMKYDAEVVAVLKVSRMACVALCEASSTCKSYNYKGVTECHMLDWRPTAPTKDLDPKLMVATGWSFFNVHPPPLPAAGNVCPGFEVVHYDQPGNLKYDFNIDGYTCINSPYITAKILSGKTDCRMKLEYNMGLFVLNLLDLIPNLQPTQEYYNVLKSCASSMCLGMVCTMTDAGGIPTFCTLVKQTHTSSLAWKTPILGSNYWYVYCTEP
ncbi:hypothetical protein Pmani_000790 [Petrolisthes manimaculis]|uniref:Apple domain-containing protein n=1 Tax=Petrolisthes manimaculis TaxID=1843537 RepID=A0AAE1QL95_9EUCA|nr:hypothetical protein Pmani_000790 [Petrolisthes manimaculis]